MRDARRIGEYYPGLSPNSPECIDPLGLSLAHLESKCANFYDAAEVERVFPSDLAPYSATNILRNIIESNKHAFKSAPTKLYCGEIFTSEFFRTLLDAVPAFCRQIRFQLDT